MTKDIQVRLIRHNSGKGAKYTASRRPVKLVWHKKFSSKPKAIKKEREIKGWRRDKKEELIQRSPSDRSSLR